MNAKQSAFMHWAKVRPKLKYDLALSGVLNLPMSELEPFQLELHGDNAYGYQPLVEALAAHCQAPLESVVTISGGTSMANHLAMAAVLNHSDEVLIEQPTYEPLLSTARYLGARITRFSRSFESGFVVVPGEVGRLITPSTRLIVLTNLHNPSSALLDQSILRQIGELARGVSAKVLVDEVYLEAVASTRPPSSFRLGPEFIVTSSLTKGYGLSGLRCGWILAQPDLADKMRRLNDLFGAVAPYPTEQLSVIALRRLPQIAARAEIILNANRSLLNEFLGTRPDLQAVHTKSGTTSFPRLVHGNVDELCTLLQDEFETAVVPGSYFEAPQHFRVGLCLEPPVFRQGLKNLSAALDRLSRSL